MKEISKIIKIRRKQMKLTQMEVSIIAEIDYHTFVKIETWATQNPSFITIMKIFSALKIDKWDFCTLLWMKFWKEKYLI